MDFNTNIEIMKKAWQAVFGKEEIAEDANFFDFGGDSIQAVQLCTWLAQKGLDLSIISIFTTPILRDLVNQVEETTPVNVDTLTQALNHSAIPPTGMPQQICTPQQQMAMVPQQMCTPQQQMAMMSQQELLQQQVAMLQQQVMMLQNMMLSFMGTVPQMGMSMSMPPMQSAPMTGTAYVGNPIDNPTVIPLQKPKAVKPTKPPMNALNLVITGILGVSILPDANFFECGMNSISAMQIVTRCGEQGYQVTMQDVFEHPTMNGLVQKMIPAM